MSYTHQVELGDETAQCLVCLLPLAGMPIVSYAHNAETESFCSNDCLRDFLQDPEKYLHDVEEEPEEPPAV
jgi:YHS domain-containing protein